MLGACPELIELAKEPVTRRGRKELVLSTAVEEREVGGLLIAMLPLSPQSAAQCK